MKNQKRRVLHVLSSSRYSGAENVACTIIDNADKKYEMAYCSPNGKICETLKARNIRFIPLKKLDYFNLKKAIKEYDPDIIHAHDYKASIVSSLITNKKIISHIHVDNPKVRSKNIISFLYKNRTNRYKTIIWVAQEAFDNYFYKDHIKNKSIILQNIIDDSKVISKSNEFSFNKKYDIIFIGRLTAQKNPYRLIRIIKQIKKDQNNIKAAIVGDGELKDEVINEINKYNLAENIDVLGYKDNPFPILKNSKIFIMTSDYEGTPMAALEAQALAKPIVSTPANGLNKIVINDYNGFLCRDEKTMAKKIEEILKPANYKKFSVNTMADFQKRNNVREYINTIEQIYEQ